MGRLARLQRTGTHAVLAKRGIFSVPEGTQGWPLASAQEDAIRKFLKRFESEGWNLETRPTVRSVRRFKSDLRTVRATDGSLMQVETGTGMQEENPLYKPGTDQYVVEAIFSRPHLTATIEVPDKAVARLADNEGVLPGGLKVC